ncbi:hypothetical protein GLOTRDRAFT_133268 [Gloeophyllum trabeum ATCC 11539]|uniref:NAD P-binding protein n=1 Tax=Gloeophyllum trabeum (strain ATCC 11539 / FP-39264 / Madison 617) TaxID=670483 RepID=S7PUB7_GLOTA|nr:uncharacterized protein GLOTRDRAFT_133268 [Gloeophyllum trabeum ATCC 11539]EPQ51406.1 hypothetical protein GLOTRDRAFT_133268 [Gloeophyllum trabeum ATCC 11539]
MPGRIPRIRPEYPSERGKLVYITGASRGVGQSALDAYARASYPSPPVAELYDVTDEKAVGDSVKKCIEKFGRIDILIANAGFVEKWKKIGAVDPDEWWKTWLNTPISQSLFDQHIERRVQTVNIRGTSNVIRIDHLVVSKGSAVLLSSFGAQLRRVSLSKSASLPDEGVHQLPADRLPPEYGSEGAKVFAVHPGAIVTVLAKGNPSVVQFLKDKMEIGSHAIVRLTCG